MGLVTLNPQLTQVAGGVWLQTSNYAEKVNLGLTGTQTEFWMCFPTFLNGEAENNATLDFTTGKQIK